MSATPLDALRDLLHACANYTEGDGDEARFKAAVKKAYEVYKVHRKLEK